MREMLVHLHNHHPRSVPAACLPDRVEKPTRLIHEGSPTGSERLHAHPLVTAEQVEASVGRAVVQNNESIDEIRVVGEKVRDHSRFVEAQRIEVNLLQHATLLL